MQKISSQNLSKIINNPALFFCQNKVIINRKTFSPILTLASTNFILTNNAFLQNETLFIEIQPPNNLNESYQLKTIKDLIKITNTKLTAQLLQGIQFINFINKYQYCSTCQNKLIHINYSYEKKCQNCKATYFPNLAPAVIVLIQKQQQILLAKHRDLKDIHALIAGFVDIGETAEEAVHRETLEETGLKIHQLQYFKSQSWPFPNSFMLAFTANYLSGEINVDHQELLDAQWFDLANLPKIPSLPSISRELINYAIAKST